MSDQKGFTLSELMITIIIIGILAAVAIPKFFEVNAKAKCVELTINFSTFERLKTFHYQTYGDAEATLEEIGMETPISNWFNYTDLEPTAQIQQGGSIATAAKGNNGKGYNSNNTPAGDEGTLQDVGTEDTDGNNGHGDEVDGCDSSNPSIQHSCVGAGNLTPFKKVGGSTNPNTLGGLTGHFFTAVSSASIGSKCQSGMGIYTNWDKDEGITRGDLKGGACSIYMHSFFN